MNWFDFVIIAIILVSAFVGMKIGLVWAAITAIGAFVGWLVAGQLSDDLGDLFRDSLSNDTLVTVISYAIITVLSIALASIVGKFVRPVLTIATMGMLSLVDKAGGLLVGIIVGLAISGALIMALARFTYNFETPTEGAAGGVVGLVKVENTKDFVEDALVGSAIVGAFIDVTDALPGDSLGFVTSEFRVPLDILEKKIEKGSS